MNTLISYENNLNSDNRVLLVDLLYKNSGSFDADISCILTANQNRKLEYFKKESSNIHAIYLLLKKLIYFKYEKVIFLSANFKHLFIFLPFTLFKKFSLIYHFLPVKNKRFHLFLLRFFGNFYSFGVYTSGVSRLIESHIRNDIAVLPSRFVNYLFVKNMLINKLNSKYYSVFIPGIRTGVRNDISINPLVKILKKNLTGKIDKIYVQKSGFKPTRHSKGIISVAQDIDSVLYNSYYKKSLIVVVNFHKDYELRASGVIIDAIRNGCIVLTTNHEINYEYGFPNTLVCDQKNLSKLITKIKSNSNLFDLIPLSNYIDFKKKWNEFLK